MSLMRPMGFSTGNLLLVYIISYMSKICFLLTKKTAVDPVAL